MSRLRLISMLAAIGLAFGGVGYMVGFSRGSGDCSFEIARRAWLLLGNAPRMEGVGMEQSKAGRRGDAEVLLAVWRVMDRTKSVLLEDRERAGNGVGDSFDGSDLRWKTETKSQILIAMSAAFVLNGLDLNEYIKAYTNIAKSLNYSGTNRHVLNYCQIADRLGGGKTKILATPSKHEQEFELGKIVGLGELIEYLSAGKHVASHEDAEIVRDGSTYITWAGGRPYKWTLWDWLKGKRASM